ncbi:MAG: amidohydrolase [Firmicutes bacterium]|nr:amidohydrolase [Bacillota bacterium]
MKPNLSNTNSNGVDILFYNGVIYTADKDNTIVEALAVKEGKIIFTGSSKDASRYMTDAGEVIDLQGRMILPGFIDSHLHAPGRALIDLYNISLYESLDLESVLKQVENFIQANPDQEIYYGEGFSLGLFSGEEVSRGPRKEHLDSVCPDKPVVIYSSDCHLAWLNSCAFNAFGIDKETDVPAGGVIEKNPVTGELWGTLKEAAMRLIPEQTFSEHQLEDAILEFQSFLHSLGYTGILSVSIASAPPLEAFYKIGQRDELKLHVNSTVTIEPGFNLTEQVELINAMRKKYSSKYHSVSTVKFFTDGVVEGATAYLLEPYSPAAGKNASYRGELLWNTERLTEAISLVNGIGLQVHVHSIGDASTKAVLDALEMAAVEAPAGDYRNTITHLQLVDPVDIKRFYDLNVIASVQPYWHCKEPGWWDVVDYHMLGERAECEYPLKSFFDTGLKVTSSSDHPVTPYPNPLRAIRAGVTRNITAEGSYGLPLLKDTDDPRGLLNKAERVSLTDMLRSFTINGAYTIFREKITGSLEPGKQADLVILDRNLFDLDPLDLESAKVMSTYFNGEIVYKREV